MRRLSPPNFTNLMLEQSDWIDARALAAGVAESHTIPAGAKYVQFSGNTDFYVKIGGAASVPAGDVTDGTASQLNPSLLFIGNGATTIGLITAQTTATVTMQFYA